MTKRVCSTRIKSILLCYELDQLSTFYHESIFSVTTTHQQHNPSINTKIYSAS